MLDDWPDEATRAARICFSEGGRIVTAGDADLAALGAAARSPFAPQLERDPDTSAILARIDEMKATVPAADPVAPCDRVEGPAPSAAGVPDTAGMLPEGTYRAQITAASLLAGGAPQQDADNHGGVWTLTFEDGALVIDDVRTRDGEHSTDEGVYCVHGGR